MKRSYNVNIGGVVFRFDEDALEVMENFMVKVAEHCKGCGEELKVTEVEEIISQKIAARVGVNGIVTVELVKVVVDEMTIRLDMGETLEDATVGEATVEDKTIKDREGASEKTSTSDANSSTDSEPWRLAMQLGQKLFRDPHDSYIGGVLSGIAKYNGLSADTMRVVLILIFLAGLFVGGITTLLIVLYCVLWIVLPKARNVADITRMRKIDPLVDVETAWRANYDVAVAEISYPKNNGCLAAGVKLLFFMMVALIGLPLLFVAGVLLFVFVVVFIALFSSFGSLLFSNAYVLLILLLPVVALVHWILKKCGVCSPLNRFVKWAIVIGWIVALSLALHKVYLLVEENGGWKEISQRITRHTLFDEEFWREIVEDAMGQRGTVCYQVWDDKSENIPFVVIASRHSNSTGMDDSVLLRFVSRDDWSGYEDEYDYDESVSVASIEFNVDAEECGSLRFVWDSIANELLLSSEKNPAKSLNMNSQNMNIRLIMPDDTLQYSNAAEMDKLPFELRLQKDDCFHMYMFGNDSIDGVLIGTGAVRYVSKGDNFQYYYSVD